MSGGAVVESARARPLSGGLWTLFSWLRRDEHSSTESVSSAGSDRTVASFAFLAPALYARAGAAPASRPPPSPPSDSYRRRVRERSLRRQRDRDLTLHRKYGLYGLGFDANSLPAPAARRPEHDRRAASESPRAHVPGKRRAPPPPAAGATIPRRRARKRPAPLPPAPARLSAATLARLEPMSRPVPDERPTRARDDATGCKPEKYSKKDTQTKETKDVKIRHEKSFLKQIFENKKRNSAIETASLRLLPNISELDKQAAEMIEKYRLKEMTPNDVPERGIGKNESISKMQTEAWICTRCLRKYDSTVITCDYCLPLNKGNDSYKSSKVSNSCTQTKSNISGVASGSSRANIEDKEKLKEILKEMKDSLPKRPKSELISSTKLKNTREMETKDYPKIVEAPTLRIGSSICMDKKPVAQTSASGNVTEQSTSQLFPQNRNKANSNALAAINSVIITQPVVLVHTQESNVVSNEIKVNKEKSNQLLPLKINATKSSRDGPNLTVTENEIKNPTKETKPPNMISKTKYDLNTPLKISSLLNPIYIPKTTSTTNTETNLVKQIDLKDTKNEKANSTSKTQPNTVENIVSFAVPPPQRITRIPETNKDDKLIPETKKKLENKELALDNNQVSTVDSKPKNPVNATPPNADRPSTSKEDRMDQHARRRDLINQLERSIAKGDEKAAAEAAVKLAQLKLSCSVLSFSSQIVGEATTSLVTPQQITVSKSVNDNKKNEAKKEDEVTQKSSITTVPEAAPAKETTDISNISKQNTDINNAEKHPKSIKENVQVNEIIKPNALVLPKVESAKKTELTCEVKISGPSEASTSKDISSKKKNDDGDVPILVWVEDKEATRGPVQLHVRRDAVMGDLRRRAERSLGLPARLQRWIVGRALCSDDRAPLLALAGPELSAPFYLCLVESDAKTVQKAEPEVKEEVEPKVKEDTGNEYNELVKLEKQPLVSNAEVFECGVCIEECRPGAGVVLRECVHSFCKECLSDVVRHSEEPVVACPAMGCRGVLQEREIRGLVSPDDYERWLARGLAAAESGTRNAFHCRTRDCAGWALCDPGVRRFPCPVCKRTNCVPCQAIHEGESCEQHRTKMESAASSGASEVDADEGTRALLNSLISRGEALECPECSAIITKKWGCDWIKCSACKTEICWVTRGRRWGPAGRGDTSAGCRCGVDGKRCHPSCGYCH